MGQHTGPTTPYWRLSGFYFCYFASLGALLPYWGLYLRDLGHDAVAIGQLMAILLATKIVAPNLWAWIADRTGRRMAIVRFGSLASLVCFAGIFADTSFAWLALVMATFSFFWNATLPQFEATTLNYLGSEQHRYSHVRLWGSVGFIATVLGLGLWFGVYGRTDLPWFLLGLFATIWLVSLTIRDAGVPPAGDAPAHLGHILRRPAVLALLGSCLLMQASHGPYYAFFSIFLDEAGYGQDLIGALWALGVLAEVVVFVFVHRLLVSCGPRLLLLASLWLTVLRWLLIGLFVDHLALLLVAQVLHAASFGVYHAAAIHLVHRFFPGRYQGRGQALYSSLSFGAGGALGSFIGGYSWVALGAEWTYLGAALLALAGALISWCWLRV